MLELLILAFLRFVPPEIHCPDQFQQGGLYICEINQSIDHLDVVYHDGKQLPVFDGRIFIGFGRDDKPQTNIYIHSKAQDITLASINKEVLKRQYDIQRIDNLDKNKVNPPKMDWDRIKKENALIGAARLNAGYNCPENINFIMPAEGITSGVYGSQRILNGQEKRPHFGIDIAAPQGDPVLAPADGKITMTHSDMFYTGGTITMDHGCGLVSVFSHLHTLDVKEGDIIKQGGQIATIGSTGRSTGPHLDWRVNLGKTRLDPMLVLEINKSQ